MISAIRRRLAQRAGVRDAALSLLVQVTNMVASLVSFMLLSRRLGPGGYGIFVAAYALIGLGVSLATVGPGLAFLQFGMRSSPQDVAGPFFGLLASLEVITITSIVVLAHWLVPSMPLSTVALFTVGELVGVGLTQLASTLRWACEGFAATVGIQVVANVVKVATIVGLDLTHHLTIRSYAIAYMLGSVVLGVVLFGWATHRLKIHRRLGAPQAPHARASLTYTATIWISNAHDSGDKLTMSALNMTRDLGWYSAAYRVFELAVVPLSAVVNSTYRTFLDPRAGDVMRRTVRYTVRAVAYAAVAAVTVALCASWALPYLGGGGFKESAEIARWLAPVLVLRAMCQFPPSALAGLGRTGLRLVAMAFPAVIGITSYVLLIPRYSWRGAVVGTYISDFVAATALWTALYRTHRVRPQPAPAA